MASTGKISASHKFGIKDVALILCFVANVLIISEAAAVVDVYRLIQYDMGGQSFGSRRAGFNHFASSGADVSGTDLSRAVIVTPVTKVDKELLSEVLQGKRFVGGFLLLLPSSFSNGTKGGDEDEDDKTVWEAIAELEQLLLHSTVAVPIYFATENERLKSLAKDVASNDLSGKPASATNGGYKLVVSSAEGRKLSSVTLTNMQGWLQGLKVEGESASLPTIAIVASYDTFGAASELSSGTFQSGSSVTALLELSRVFSRLYANPKTRPRFNLLFGLTAGGPYNFDGTRQWLASLDQRVLENVEFAICLDAIGSQGSEELFIHSSKRPQDPAVAPFYQGFAFEAANEGLPLTFVHKKINISDARVPWQHEWFSKSKVPAATLSQLSGPSPIFSQSGGIADRRQLVSDLSVVKAVKLTAETLAKYIYGFENKSLEIFAEGTSLGVSLPFVSHWLDFLSQSPRVAPFLTKKSPVIVALEKELALHVQEVQLQSVILDKSFVFYDSAKAKLEIYQVASVAFDLVVLLAIGTYLGGLFVVLHIITKGLDDLLSIFGGSSTKKKYN